MFHKRKYTPVFPEKYMGDPTNIIMRSSWETMFANWCDKNPAVIKWKSEETIVPYRCPTDNRIHRYFVDFLVTKVNKEGLKETMIIEVKPSRQTKPPKKKEKVTKTYITEVKNWGVNSAKWKAAEEFCKDRGWTFHIFTEKELGLKNGSI